KSSLSLNLLSSGEINYIWERHILDSLWPLVLGVLEPPCSVLDVGSGAGFPGVPMAISDEDARITMVESVGKKARFVERAINRLGVENANIVNCRIEHYKLLEAFDYCTSRAFASIQKSLPMFSRFVKRDGKILFFKGPDAAREISEAEKFQAELSLSVPQIIEIPSKYSSRGFNLVVYKRL
ncbi:MAG: 16S rRNA (guanine(527)-N(7))-methyltransferase RsmG, partial [bacterium]